MPPAPMIEVAGLVGVAPLAHHRILAAFPRQVGSRARRHAGDLGLCIELIAVLDRFLEALGRLQLLQIVGRIDDHLDPRPAVHHLFQPLGEQRRVKNDHHVGRLHRVERALALSDGRHAHLCPRRYAVDAHLVDIGAEILGRGERALDIGPARRQIAQARHGLTRFHIAKLELPAEQQRELAGVDLLSALGDVGHGDLPDYENRANLSSGGPMSKNDHRSLVNIE